MSGSGGPGIDTNFISGTGGPSGASCQALAFETTIASPDPSVVATLRVGDVLSVQVVGSPPQIALYTGSGAQVGALTVHWRDLVRCTEAGFEYQATVVALTPAVRVHVQHRR